MMAGARNSSARVSPNNYDADATWWLRAGSMVSTESATSDIIIAVREMNSANPNSGISPFVMKHLWGCFRKLITEYVKRFHNITRDSYLLDFQ